jgi:hypothetical protein
LREKKYANSPVNDMASIEVPPLLESDAIKLAGLLMAGEVLRTDDEAVAAAAVAREADCFPFYIHHIVRALKIRGWDATPEKIAAVVASQLVEADDPWQLLHYRVRIPLYYGNDQETVRLVLDELAVRPDAAQVNELLARLKSASTFDDRERLLHLLSLMDRDHYLKRDEDGRYRFRFPLIRRWWKINRGL